MWAALQTMKMTYQQIIQGERAWNALGDFLNYWYSYATDQRAELVREPLHVPTDAGPELRQWGAFCAAAVEYLCERYDIPCPGWVYDPAYTLTEPCFRGLGASRPHVQTRLILESPACFAKRNIYCSPRVFANKYETAEVAVRLQPQPA
ncbi:MAG: hypothetical protein E6J34_14985 [Chloroflexi bacterium]|nr:MAG: hypothetical protein E6J34_14985 [Chloroflexota bacterium]